MSTGENFKGKKTYEKASNKMEGLISREYEGQETRLQTGGEETSVKRLVEMERGCARQFASRWKCQKMMMKMNCK